MPTSRRDFLTTAAGIAAGGTLAAVPAFAAPPQVDGELRQALADIIEINAALNGLFKKYGDDADSRGDFLELEARLDHATDTLISVPASSMAGIKAKAAALHLNELFTNDEAHKEIAVSLANDLIALG